MTTDAILCGDHAPGSNGADVPLQACSSKSEQRGLPLAIDRMMGLETAARMLGGKAKLAEALCCTPRSIHYKVEAGRGISNLDLNLAAAALEERADALRTHALKLRGVAGHIPAAGTHRA